MWLRDIMTRSSHPDVFSKKGYVKNFATLSGKHLCWCLCFDEVSGPI